VLDWPALLSSEAFRRLDMLQQAGGLTTPRAPLRIDGVRSDGSGGAPGIDEHGDSIRREFDL